MSRNNTIYVFAVINSILCFLFGRVLIDNRHRLVGSDLLLILLAFVTTNLFICILIWLLSKKQ